MAVVPVPARTPTPRTRRPPLPSRHGDVHFYVISAEEEPRMTADLEVCKKERKKKRADRNTLPFLNLKNPDF
jgi:hypothetical protein